MAHLQVLSELRYEDFEGDLKCIPQYLLCMADHNGSSRFLTEKAFAMICAARDKQGYSASFTIGNVV